MKILHTAMAVFVGFATLSAINTASAARVAGYGPCYLEAQSLQKSGFSEQRAYTPAGIAQFMKMDAVTMHGLDKLDPNCLYKLTYSCRVDHGIVRNVLHATAQDRRATIQSADVHWETTSPQTYLVKVPL